MGVGENKGMEYCIWCFIKVLFLWWPRKYYAIEQVGKQIGITLFNGHVTQKLPNLAYYSRLIVQPLDWFY